MQRIKVLVPYFGGWPRWFRIFLTTCEYNPQINWHFFSDTHFNCQVPKNVEWSYLSLNDIASMVTEKTGVEVCQLTPFKLCDFRPAFGVIFSEYLDGFDFWAWGDIDVVYGDIDRVITPGYFSKFDVVSVRSEFLSGELTFLRNSFDVNNSFKENCDYQRVFASQQNYNFCELGFFGDYDMSRKIESFTETIYAAHLQRKLNVCLRDFGHNDRKTRAGNLNLLWQTGHLWDMRTGSETALYHFLDLKKHASFVIPCVDNDEELKEFFVSSQGISVGKGEALPKRKPFNQFLDKLHRAIRCRRAKVALHRRLRPKLK
jgi:hypothetical protein